MIAADATWVGSAKSAVQSTEDTREEARRQTLVVLQHDELVREASEFRSHARTLPVLGAPFNTHVLIAFDRQA